MTTFSYRKTQNDDLCVLYNKNSLAKNSNTCETHIVTLKKHLYKIISTKQGNTDFFTIELYWYFRSWYSSRKLQTPGIYINYSKCAPGMV